MLPFCTCLQGSTRTCPLQHRQKLQCHAAGAVLGRKMSEVLVHCALGISLPFLAYIVYSLAFPRLKAVMLGLKMAFGEEVAHKERTHTPPTPSTPCWGSDSGPLPVGESFSLHGSDSVFNEKDKLLKMSRFTLWRPCLSMWKLHSFLAHSLPVVV